MNIKRKCQVVMLPTKNKSNIQLQMNEKLHLENGSSISLKSYQHLYIILDEEIKEDDWYIDDCNQIRRSVTSDKEYWSVREDYKKIIATTDTSLKIHHFNKGVFKNLEYLLPQPSQEFIRQYIEEYNKGNVISDVEVEYDKATYDKWLENGASPVFDTLKVNSDNTININPTKDKWSREEVIEFGLKCVNLGMDLNNNPSPRLNEMSGKDYYYKWIEENL